MKRLVLMMIPALICGMMFVGCVSDRVQAAEEEEGVSPFGCSEEIDNVAVKAKIMKFNEEEFWVEYELASIEIVNGKIELSELNFPETVPDEYLRPPTESYDLGLILCDIKTKIAIPSIYAYNRAGTYNGAYELYSDNWTAHYIYADRSYTVKGKSIHGTVYDCLYEKGWNMMYYGLSDENGWICTTQKPLNVDFKWHYIVICID